MAEVVNKTEHNYLSYIKHNTISLLK